MPGVTLGSLVSRRIAPSGAVTVITGHFVRFGRRQRLNCGGNEFRGGELHLPLVRLAALERGLHLLADRWQITRERRLLCGRGRCCRCDTRHP